MDEHESLIAGGIMAAVLIGCSCLTLWCRLASRRNTSRPRRAGFVHSALPVTQPPVPATQPPASPPPAYSPPSPRTAERLQLSQFQLQQEATVVPIPPSAPPAPSGPDHERSPLLKGGRSA